MNISLKAGRLFCVFFVFYLLLPSISYSENSDIDPMADKILRQMSEYLKGLDHFIIRAETAYETVLDTGQKLTYLNQVSVYLQRPNRLYVHRTGMIRDQEIFYNGKTLTIFGRKKRLYAIAQVPPTLDSMFDYAISQLHLTAPGSDLFYTDVYGGLMGDVESGMYIGKNKVNGIMCHHLAYRGSEVDWQLWVEDGPCPIPRKYVITTKWVTGAPEYSMTILDFDSKTPIPGPIFIFKPPKDAKRVAFLTPSQIERLKKHIKEQRK